MMRSGGKRESRLTVKRPMVPRMVASTTSSSLMLNKVAVDAGCPVLVLAQL